VGLAPEERKARRKRCEKRWSGFFVGDSSILDEEDKDQVFIKGAIRYLLIYVLVVSDRAKQRKRKRLQLKMKIKRLL
jgi:hypothetical protein